LGGAESHATAAARTLASASQRLVWAMPATTASFGGRRRVSSPPSTSAPTAGHAGASAPRIERGEGSARTGPLVRSIPAPSLGEPGEPRGRYEAELADVPVRGLLHLRQPAPR